MDRPDLKRHHQHADEKPQRLNKQLRKVYLIGKEKSFEEILMINSFRSRRRLQVQLVPRMPQVKPSVSGPSWLNLTCDICEGYGADWQEQLPYDTCFGVVCQLNIIPKYARLISFSLTCISNTANGFILKWRAFPCGSASPRLQ